MICAIGDNFLLQHFLNVIQAYLAQENDWRYKHVAHIMLSEVAEYISDETKLAELVNLACNDYQNEHPKIRWSSMHIIGQVCEDHSP